MTMDATAQTGLEGGSVDHTTLLDGATQLAQSLGISAEPGRAEPWPIDVGQRSITAEFRPAVAGSAGGALYLSLAEEDADKLLADPEGADGVIRDLLATLGVSADEVEHGSFEPAADLPVIHVVARDPERVLGFGLTVHEESGPPDGLGRAAPFEPAQMSPTAGGGTVPGGGASLGAPITMLADVDMQVTVELGRTTLPVRELLSLQPGMVVELERQAGAPIDVLVNGRLIARGEVVVLDEQFGLRITEIVTDIVGGH